MTTLALIGALGVIPAERVEADAGDFIGGAIVGGVIGHAIGRDQQRRRTVTTTRRVYRPSIPRTEHGRQTQTALNYFGFNAGSVDGQIGSGTRRAIERYQAHMGYPVNGHAWQPYQFDHLIDAYYWAINGGQAQTGRTGRPLLAAYTQMMAGGGATMAAVPAVPQPQPQVVAPAAVAAAPAPAPVPAAPVPPAPNFAAASEASDEPATRALPNLFAGNAPSPSLANRCNAVMLQTSSNGGYTTLAAMNDPDFALSEQFCLARSYAIGRGEDLMGAIQGMSAAQIGDQCEAFGEGLAGQVDAVSLKPRDEAEAGMRDFALSTGMPLTDLAATSRVCLAVGYSRDNMPLAIGAALLLVTLGEPAYAELLGHHLREGFGTAKRPDLAVSWYDAGLTALDAGAPAVFMPGQSDRPMLIRAAVSGLQPGIQGKLRGQPQPTQAATLPTFKISD